MLRYYVISFSFLLLLNPLPAAARGCDDLRPYVKLNYNVEAITYDRSQSVSDLTDSKGHSNQHVLGKASGESGISFDFTFNAQPYGGLYCLSLTHVRAEFYTRPVINIARNLKRGSCEYNAVLRHEREHVDILKKAHREYISPYGRYLKEITRDLPVFAPTDISGIEAQQQQVVDYIGQQMQIFMDDITEDVARRQAEIDTPEEYARVREQCDDWDDRINNE